MARKKRTKQAHTPITVKLTPSQAKFLALKSKFSAFVGGYNCGKSFTMGFVAVRDWLMAPETAIIALYEPSHDLIRTVAMPTVMFWLDHFGYTATKNKNEGTITVEGIDEPSFLFKTMMEPELLIGYQSSTALFDELDTLPLDKAELVWQKASSRNRLQPATMPEEFKTDFDGTLEYNNRAYVFTTPEGYNFCYKYFDQNPDENYQQVQACSLENPTVSKAWVESLLKIHTPHKIRAYLYGEYVNMEASTVYHMYNRTACGSDEYLTEHDTLHVGVDFNVDNTTAIVCVKRWGTWHAVAEHTKVYDAPALARLLKEKYPNNEIVLHPDSSGGNRNAANASSSALSVLSQFRIDAPLKNPFIKDRVMAVNMAFNRKQLFVNVKRCPELTKCLEQQPYDKNEMPSKSSGLDHAVDAFGYFVNVMLPLEQKLAPIDITYVV
jgi:hypothetical protein